MLNLLKVPLKGTFKVGNIIVFCKNRTKHTKDYYILALVTNNVQL